MYLEVLQVTTAPLLQSDVICYLLLRSGPPYQVDTGPGVPCPSFECYVTQNMLP